MSTKSSKPDLLVTAENIQYFSEIDLGQLNDLPSARAPTVFEATEMFAELKTRMPVTAGTASDRSPLGLQPNEGRAGKRVIA